MISERCRSKTKTRFETEVDAIREVIISSEQNIQAHLRETLLVSKVPNNVLVRLACVVDVLWPPKFHFIRSIAKGDGQLKRDVWR